MTLWRRMLGNDRTQPDDTFVELRSQVLRLQPDNLGIDRDESRPVYGILMEMGLRGGSATLVCLADGAVSVYTSTGGGVIGAGGHESVRHACIELISWANQYAQDFIAASHKAEEFPLPGQGAVFFYLLTTGGVFQAQCKEAKVVAGRDPFSNLFVACQGVLTKARETAPGQEIN